MSLRPQVLVALFGAFIIFLAGVVRLSFYITPGPDGLGPVSLAMTSSNSFSHTIPSHSNCTVRFTLQSRQYVSPQAKPVWVVGYPTAGGPPSAGSFGDVMRGLVAGLTGYTTGAKSFHVSSGSLKRCRSKDPNDVVVTCGCLHPIVKLAPPPEARKVDFSESVILLIRNPRTNIPAYHNDKAIKYHGQKGQVMEDDWRRFRDLFLEKALDEWTGLIREWKATTYKITYVDYDQMMSPSGVAAVERVANVLQQAGFPTAGPDDLECIWYHAVDPLIRAEADFQSYSPTYTALQKDFMVEKLIRFEKEIESDEELAALVTSYVKDIRERPMTDRVFNATS
jgi:hypothetical protein